LEEGFNIFNGRACINPCLHASSIYTNSILKVAPINLNKPKLFVK
jgi:hypothetical protein